MISINNNAPSVTKYGLSKESVLLNIKSLKAIASLKKIPERKKNRGILKSARAWFKPAEKFPKWLCWKATPTMVSPLAMSIVLIRPDIRLARI